MIDEVKLCLISAEKHKMCFKEAWFPKKFLLEIAIGHFEKKLAPLTKSFGCPIYPKKFFLEETHSILYRVFNFPKYFSDMS